MKTWFVYLINGKKIGTWANNTDEAKRNLRKKYGDVEMKFIGINCGDVGVQPEEIIHTGMSPVDTMIAFGFANMFVGLRYAR